jgi:heme exporter protein B
MGALAAIAAQTARLSLREGGAFVALVFFLSVIVAVPFGVGPDLKLLARIGPAILWIAALLATLLGLDRLFRDDREDGSLDLYLLSDMPLELIVLAKCAGAWVGTGLPLVIAAPLLGVLLGMEPVALLATMLTLLIGTPALVLVGSIGAALTAALGRGGIVVAILVLPFTIPVLVFGVSTALAATTSGQVLPPALVLVALTLIGAVVAPVASAAALRAGLE